MAAGDLEDLGKAASGWALDEIACVGHGHRRAGSLGHFWHDRLPPRGSAIGPSENLVLCEHRRGRSRHWRAVSVELCDGPKVQDRRLIQSRLFEGPAKRVGEAAYLFDPSIAWIDERRSAQPASRSGSCTWLSDRMSTISLALLQERPAEWRGGPCASPSASSATRRVRRRDWRRSPDPRNSRARRCATWSSRLPLLRWPLRSSGNRGTWSLFQLEVPAGVAGDDAFQCRDLPSSSRTADRRGVSL